LKQIQLPINETDSDIPDLKLNAEYSSWDDVEKALLKYGCNNGFGVRKRTQPVNGRMTGISFYCDRSGTNIPKKQLI